MKERRHHIRWQINRQAKVRLENAQTFTQCFIKDINFKGLQISLRTKLPEETFLRLSTVLSDEFTLDIEAWVVWHKSVDGFHTYSLYFTKLKDQDKEKIYKFVYKFFPQEATKRWGRELGVKKGGEIMEDRRIFARFPMNFPLRFIDVDRNKEGEAQTQDISAKGIGLVTDREVVPNTPLELWLEIPDRGEPLYTRGRVAWSTRLGPNKYRLGINLEKAELMGVSRIFRV